MIYVGKTKNLKRRIKEYKYKSRSLNTHSKYRIMEVINEIGFDKFSFDILEDNIDNDYLDEREIFWINKLNARNPSIGYNSKTGGRGGTLIDDSKKKMSESSKGFRHTNEEKLKRSKPIFVFHDNKLIPKVSAKLYADSIGKSRSEVTHAIKRGIRINGDFVFYQDKNLRKECYFNLISKRNFLTSDYNIIYKMYFYDD